MQTPCPAPAVVQPSAVRSANTSSIKSLHTVLHPGQARGVQLSQTNVLQPCGSQYFTVGGAAGTKPARKPAVLPPAASSRKVELGPRPEGYVGSHSFVMAMGTEPTEAPPFAASPVRSGLLLRSPTWEWSSA